MTRRTLNTNVDKLCRCYDNGGCDKGGSFDRYTVVYTSQFKRYLHKTARQVWYVAMSTYPFHPQGFGQHGEAPTFIDARCNSWGPVSVGKKNHLGTRILFKDLPKDCKKLVLSDLRDLHNVK